jgi:hypothetical protein
MDIRESAEKIKRMLSQDLGVYHVDFGDRFGSATISVHCVSAQDRERIKSNFPDRFDGFYVYVTSPIWGVGHLLPEYARQITEISQLNKKSNEYGSPEQKALALLYDEAMHEEEEHWAKLTEGARREFISYWIKKQRQRIEDYANCGDKFLLKD